MKRRLILIDGKVENTGFRFYVYRSAVTTGIRGSVRMQGSRVMIEAEGEEEPLQMFTELCRKGPESCQVDSLQSFEKELIGYDEFRIL